MKCFTRKESIEYISSRFHYDFIENKAVFATPLYVWNNLIYADVFSKTKPDIQTSYKMTKTQDFEWRTLTLSSIWIFEYRYLIRNHEFSEVNLSESVTSNDYAKWFHTITSSKILNKLCISNLVRSNLSYFQTTPLSQVFCRRAETCETDHRPPRYKACD